MTKPVYLDYHATTPVDPRVLDAMLPYFTERFGNAASRQHTFGWEAQKAVDRGREQVAALIGASANEIVFTSGASESNNLAIKGAAYALRERGNHIITAVTEHKSVLDSYKRLESEGWRVTWLRVDRDGFVDLDELRAAIDGRTVLLSIMAANNEIGVIQPLAALGAIAREHGVLFHTDAAQAAGKIPIDVAAMQIDLLSLTGHKYYGPKGAGALYVRRCRPRLPLVCQIDGGGHENGFRSGTLNVPGIVGLGEAAEICRQEMAAEAVRLSALRDGLLDSLGRDPGDVRVNGPLGDRRLPHNLHISFTNVEGEALLMALGDLAVSTGSACSSGSQAPSHVLQAIGAVDDPSSPDATALRQGQGGPEARRETRRAPSASIRFGLGRTTTPADVDFAATRVATVVRALRAKSAVKV